MKTNRNFPRDLMNKCPNIQECAPRLLNFLSSSCTKLLLVIIASTFATLGSAEEPILDKKPNEAVKLSDKNKETAPVQDILAPGAEEEAPETNFYHEFFNMLITLAFLLLLLIGISWFLKRMNLSRIQFANQGSNIKILDQRALSQKSALFVVEYAGKKHLLAESSSGITLVSSDRYDAQEEHENTPQKKFSDLPI